MLPPGLDAGRVRAAVLDLDGTLIDHSGRPSERSTRAIAAVEATGVRCVIATGRMFRSAQRIADLLGVTAPLVCYQGALVRDPCSGETLVHRPIGLALAREILAELGDWATSTNVYVDDELYVSNDNEPARLYAELAGVPMHVVGDLASWLSVPTTKIVTVGEPVLLVELAARMAAIFGQRAFVATSLPQYLEFAAEGVDKASGAAAVGELLGFSAADAIAFGDGDNDLELLEWASIGVCVGDGSERLRAICDWSVPPVEEDGVALFLEGLAAARS